MQEKNVHAAHFCKRVILDQKRTGQFFHFSFHSRAFTFSSSSPSSSAVVVSQLTLNSFQPVVLPLSLCWSGVTGTDAAPVLAHSLVVVVR